MPWQISWSDQAVRDLATLDRAAARRIVTKREIVSANPRRRFVRLVGADECKLRVGDYRVLAELDHATKRIMVSRVGHRSKVYQR